MSKTSHKRSSKDNEFIKQVRELKGLPPSGAAIPEEQEDGPRVFDDLLWIWNGFLILSASRPVGMSGPLHITFSEIVSYCNLYDITGHRKKIDFADFVKMLDTIWIEDYYDKDKKRRQAEERERKNKK